jgi:hypothetical protein
LREFIESEYSVQPDWNLIEEEIVREVELLWEVCKNEAFPSAEALLDGVYWKDE